MSWGVVFMVWLDTRVLVVNNVSEAAVKFDLMQCHWLIFSEDLYFWLAGIR